MNVVETKLPGVRIVEPRIFGDARGYFFESYNEERYRALGIPGSFVQDNVSFSSHGVLRGMHAQNPFGQSKLIGVLSGEVYDVALDVRAGSPTFGQWVSVVLSAENKRQLFIPAGFAHGFCVTSPTATFTYKCTELYHPEAEFGVVYSDPDLAIDWPVREPILAERDARYPRLRDIPQARLPRYVAAG